MKDYDESYSKIIREHKYKDNDKDTDLRYIFEILMTHSFQI